MPSKKKKKGNQKDRNSRDNFPLISLITVYWIEGKHTWRMKRKRKAEKKVWGRIMVVIICVAVNIVKLLERRDCGRGYWGWGFAVYKN